MVRGLRTLERRKLPSTEGLSCPKALRESLNPSQTLVARSCYPSITDGRTVARENDFQSPVAKQRFKSYSFPFLCRLPGSREEGPLKDGSLQAGQEERILSF